MLKSIVLVAASIFLAYSLETQHLREGVKTYLKYPNCFFNKDCNNKQHARSVPVLLFIRSTTLKVKISADC